MYAARSEQRKAIAFATSCGSPARRNTVRLDHPLVHLGVAEVERLGADDPRDDRVARDPVAPALERERLRQAEQPRLRRRVARLAEAAERAGDRGHVHDPAPAALLHVRPHRLRAVERAGQVDAQVALPELGLWSPNCATWSSVPALLTRMSTEPNSSTDRVDRRVDLLAVGDVALDRERAAAELLDLARGRLGVDDPLRARDLGERRRTLRRPRVVRLDLDVGDHDVRAGAGERQRVGPPEPARAARDERDPPGRSISIATRAGRSLSAITSRWIWDVPS